MIELLPRAARARLLAMCEPVEYEMGEVLGDVGLPTGYAYFPTEGFVSLMTTSTGVEPLEVGMVGCEGMVGTQLVLGIRDDAAHAVVLVPGAAWRIDSAEFSRELIRSSVLQRRLSRYIHIRMLQLATAAACVRFHLIAPRLARWLLMAQDRASADNFHVTHEFLAYMMGVRRVSITMAARALQRDELITYRRGEIQVLNRRGLKLAACSCYAADREVYADVLG